jgi:HEPN domain-containing protein
MSNPDDPAAWVAKADNDLLNIANNLNDARIPWDTICFHAQQAAEKMLKAFLVSHAVVPPRTHDLVTLLHQCVSRHRAFASLQDDCTMLFRYAVESRYPQGTFEATEVEGNEAVAAAHRICDSVRQQLKQP